MKVEEFIQHILDIEKKFSAEFGVESVHAYYVRGDHVKAVGTVFFNKYSIISNGKPLTLTMYFMSNDKILSLIEYLGSKINTFKNCNLGEIILDTYIPHTKINYSDCSEVNDSIEYFIKQISKVLNLKISLWIINNLENKLPYLVHFEKLKNFNNITKLIITLPILRKVNFYIKNEVNYSLRKIEKLLGKLK